MGGAFLASSDDASAAFTNPAGLAFYGKLEVSVEGRLGRQDTSFLAGGRVSGQVTNRGLDTIAGPIYADDTDRRGGLAFISFMAPVKRRVVITGYRHEVARMNNSFISQGVFLRATFDGILNDANRELPSAAERRFSVTNYGGAIGVKVNDTLAIGAGLSLYQFHLEADSATHSVLLDTFSLPDFSVTTETRAHTGNDFSVSVNGGVLWSLHPAVHVGASFRRGPRFDFTRRQEVFDSGSDFTSHGQFKVPDVWGAGVKWIPLQSERLRLMLDASRVNYSQLRTDFIDGQTQALGGPERLGIDDGVEIRAGGEYQLGNTRILIPRIGIWRDPDHSVRYVSKPAHDATDVYYEATLPGGEAVMHFTFGVGIVWSELFEVHVGSDLSSRSKLLTASFVARFKRTGVAPPPRAP
jgi:long-subunit fatty acid transport protein